MAQKVQHTPAQCSIKLSALLDKVKHLKGLTPQALVTELDQCEALAREIERESEFINNLR